MPGIIRIDIQTKVVYSIFSGEVGDAEFIDQLGKIRAHPDFNPAFSQIVDCTAVTSVTISTGALQHMATSTSIFYKESLRIIVAPTALIFGLSRMYQMMGEATRSNIHIVRSLEEAFEILKSPGR